MRVAHFDIFAGISGDMILGALIDAGLDARALHKQLSRLPLPPFGLTARKVARGEMSGTKLEFELPSETAHRTLRDLVAMLEASPFSERVRARTQAVFRRLAVAESRIHGVAVEEIHFHEVGAMDSILDLTGAMLGLEMLEVDRVTSSSVPLGRGVLECAHGAMPVPAPATLECLRGIPCRPGLADGEVTTPTGAAFIAEVASEFGDLPSCVPEAIGYGAGSREGERVPNLLRVLLGRLDPVRQGEILRLETNVDDTTPQLLGYLMERLFEAGALDVYFTPIQMKKNRPGTQISVLADEQALPRLRDLVLAETTTLGVRYHRLDRWELPREVVTLETRFGAIRVKRAPGKAWPEYEDCAAAARRAGVPLRQVHDEVLELARQKS